MKAIKLTKLFLLGCFMVIGALISCNEVEDEEIILEMGNFVDSRDATIYGWVKLGEQVWMTENLKYTGSEIKHITDKNEWYNDNYDGWCFLDNNPDYADEYGVLYQWEAAKLSCPDGWHLPSVKEWHQLEDYLIANGYYYNDVPKNIAKSLASDFGWVESTYEGAIGNSDYPDCRNKTNFSALPGGKRYGYPGTFNDIMFEGYWWTSTDYKTSLAYLFSLSCDSTILISRGESKNDGFSVRCIKN